jgi:hypothetical protein
VSISPQDRARLESALDKLTDAMEAHLEAATTRNESKTQAAYTAFRHAAEAYDDALFDLTGEVTPWEFPQGPHIDVEYEDVSAEPTDIGVLLRRDYRLSDADALVAAGRAAYADLYADHPEEAAVTDVTHAGRALYQMLHAYGVDGLDAQAEESGLTPRGGTVWVQALTERDADSLADDPFGVVDEELLVYRLDEIIEATDSA